MPFQDDGCWAENLFRVDRAWWRCDDRRRWAGVVFGLVGITVAGVLAAAGHFPWVAVGVMAGWCGLMAGVAFGNRHAVAIATGFRRRQRRAQTLSLVKKVSLLAVVFVVTLAWLSLRG